LVKFKYVFLILILLFAAACSQQVTPRGKEAEKEELEKPLFQEAQSYISEGFNFYYPGDWVILEEEKGQETVTLRLQEEDSSAGQKVISYYPGEGITREEALAKAEKLLRSSLFRIKEDLQIKEEKIGEKEIPLIHTRSGEKETKVVQTAVFTGEKGLLLATLIAREEKEDYFLPLFHNFLEGVNLE